MAGALEIAVMLAVFLIGAVMSVIAVISLAIRREDRLHSLEGQSGSARGAPAAARRLVGIGRRAHPGIPALRAGIRCGLGEERRRRMQPGGRRSRAACTAEERYGYYRVPDQLCRTGGRSGVGLVPVFRPRNSPECRGAAPRSWRHRGAPDPQQTAPRRPTNERLPDGERCQNLPGHGPNRCGLAELLETHGPSVVPCTGKRPVPAPPRRTAPAQVAQVPPGGGRRL